MPDIHVHSGLSGPRSFLLPHVFIWKLQKAVGPCSWIGIPHATLGQWVLGGTLAGSWPAEAYGTSPGMPVAGRDCKRSSRESSKNWWGKKKTRINYPQGQAVILTPLLHPTERERPACQRFSTNSRSVARQKPACPPPPAPLAAQAPTGSRASAFEAAKLCR